MCPRADFSAPVPRQGGQGAGVTPGVSHGVTDELGRKAVQDARAAGEVELLGDERVLRRRGTLSA